MKEHEFLEHFEKILKEEEFDCSLIMATEEVPYERLLIFLGVDEKERERILEVTALKQAFINGLDPSESHEPDFFRIQFQTILPFSVSHEATSQVSSLICYLNRLIELPGLEFDEIRLQVFHRYILLYGEEKFNKKMFLSLVGLIMLLLELFSSTLEKVASGETSFNELLEQIIHMAQRIKQ